MLGEKETYKFLEILEADTIIQWKWKKKIKKDNFGWTRKLLETKLCSRNLIKRVNTGTILKIDEGRTQTNEPENKKTNDDA